MQRYAGRLSGPLRDRIDLVVPLSALPAATLHAAQPGECSAHVRVRVLAARARQRARDGHRLNAQLDGRQLLREGRIAPEARVTLLQAVERLGLSARAYYRVLRVAQTIADLASAPSVETAHVAEALQFRSEVGLVRLRAVFVFRSLLAAPRCSGRQILCGRVGYPRE